MNTPKKTQPMNGGTDNAQGNEMNTPKKTQGIQAQDVFQHVVDTLNRPYQDRAEDVMDACSDSAQGHAEGWGVPKEARKSPQWFAAYMQGAAAMHAAQIQKAGAVEAARIVAAATDRLTAAIQKRKAC